MLDFRNEIELLHSPASMLTAEEAQRRNPSNNQYMLGTHAIMAATTVATHIAASLAGYQATD